MMNSCKQKVEFPYLQEEEVLAEILLRLPFESLLSYKLVSKQWRNLINNPKFQRLYNNKCVALQFSGNRLLCLLKRHTTTTTTTNHQFPPYTLHRIPIQPNSGNGYKDFELFSGSSNTIGCLKMPKHDYYFYNLFTGASRTVKTYPKPGDQERRSWTCYGFGYDRYADDYKIFEVYENYAKPNKEFRFYSGSDHMHLDTDRFWVYSFKNRGWKSFQGYPCHLYDRPLCEAACSFNGVLHWVVNTRPKGGEIRKRVLLTFHLHASKFGEIELPVAGAGKVSELDGRLCFVNQTNVGLCVWVMQEYGVTKSWTKLFAFDVKRSSDIGRRFEQATPTMLYERGDGGKVLLFTRCVRDHQRMFWYDIDKMEIQEIQDQHPFMRRRGAKMHVLK